jgi:hypothetical protein
MNRLKEEREIIVVQIVKDVLDTLRIITYFQIVRKLFGFEFNRGFLGIMGMISALIGWYEMY